MSRKTRKLIWSVPLVATLAIVGALALFMTLTPNAALAHGLPGAVTNLEAKEDGTKAVDLSWTAPSTGGAPTMYRIDVSADGQSWSAHATTTVNSYRDEKLAKSAGSVRYYRVFAVNSAGTGPVSETAGPADVPLIGAPGGVTGLKIAVAANKKAINLTWNAPAKDGGAPIENYLVVYARTEGALGAAPTSNAAESSVSEVRDTGNSVNLGIAKTADATTSYTLNGTMANEQWWVRVYAYNGAGISTAALETRTTGNIPLGDPDPPTGVTAVQRLGTTNVNLYWYWPASNGGQDIAGFQYRVRTGSGGWGAATATASAPINISADATYEGNDDATDADITNRFQVRTVAGVDANEKMSSWSSEARLTIDDGSITTAYTIGSDCSALPTSTAEERAAKTLCERHTGLLKAQVNNADVGPTGGVLELSAARDGKGNVEITISRNTPEKAATSFRIDVADVRAVNDTPPSARWRPVLDSTGNLGTGGELVYEYLDETTGSQLQYRVFGKQGSIIVPANATVRYVKEKTVSAPSKVNNLTATGVSATQIDVSWTAPESDGDAAIDMYCVQVSANVAESPNVTEDLFDDLAEHGTDDDDTAEDLCAVGTTTIGTADTFQLVEGRSYSHKKLDAASTWYFRVYAINNPVFGGDNRAMFSDTIGGITKGADKPAMPDGLVAEQAKDSNYGGSANSGVYVTWNAPADPAGAEIDGYRVERMVNQGSWTTLDSNTDSTETIFYDILEAPVGEMRAYRVAARVGSNVGPWSNTAYYPSMHTVDTPHNASPMSVGTILDVTVMVDGMRTSTMAASSYFSDADAGDMLTYSASSSDDTVATAMINTDGMIVVSGVAEGMATITVTATDAAGAYVMQTFMVTVEAADTMLTAPSGVTATAEVDDDTPLNPVNNVTVEWTDGQAALSHLVMLFNTSANAPDWDLVEPVATMQDDEMTTFRDVAAGTYIAVVVAYDANVNIQLGVSAPVTVGGN